MYSFLKGVQYIYETGLNFRILPDASVKLMRLSDLFDNSKDWLTPLLIRAVRGLKREYGAEAFWDGSASEIEAEISTGPDKPKYIHSFVYTGRDTLILIFNELSLMPNAQGMPIVEISTEDLPHYKGISP